MTEHSIASAAVDIGTGLDIIDFDAYDDKELARLGIELEKKLAMIELENNMFDSYMTRVVPQSSKEDGEGGLANQDQETNGAPGDRANKERREKKKKGEKVKEIDKPILLNSEQKCDIAGRELEELRDKIERDKEDWAKVIDNYKAELEESEIRSVEMKKALYEFKRDIEGGALNTRTRKVIAERIVRYFEEKIRAKDTIIEKIRLKNVTLKVQKNKLHLQLRQKEEMGEVLHAIDFDQLQIENKQYLAKIEERNSELMRLKLTAGNTIQNLNSYKKRLSNLSLESQRLRVEIEQRRDLLTKLNSEEKIVEGEKIKAGNLNSRLLKEIDQYSVPGVVDYVQIKASQHELLKKLKGWQRKVEITSLQAKRMRNVWHRIITDAEQEKTDRVKKRPSHLPDLKLKVGQ